MTIEQIASAWAQGLASDFTELDRLQAPTMEVWHSTDDAWISREESRRRAEQIEAAGRPALRDVRTTVTDHGFVLQAAIDNPNDPTRVTFLVQVVSVEGDQVERVEEYVAPGRRAVDRRQPD